MIFAPGRVNLLGGHVDYNAGRVLPVAVDRGVWAAARRVQAGFRVASTAFDDVADLDGDRAPPDWARLFAGCARALDADAPVGLEVALASDLPVGAGLSSSAASAVAFVAVARALGEGRGDDPAADQARARWSEDALTLARRAQAAEHAGLGVRCGLMDPLVSAAGRRGHVVDLDCRDETFSYLPLDTSEAAIVVVPSPADRRLAGSAYNQRRSGCEQVLAAVQARFPEVRSLRDLRLAQLDAVELEAQPRRWARHVIGEMARVELARRALASGDLEAFGQLMYAAHESLRDLYAVSTPALDAQIATCRAAPESFGGRLTGAGFGGATVHLVRRARVASFCARFEAAEVLETADGPEAGIQS